MPLSLVAGERPIACCKQSPGSVLARITGARKGAIVDGMQDDDVCERLLGMVRRTEEVTTRRQGARRASTVADYDPDHEGGASWDAIAGRSEQQHGIRRRTVRAEAVSPHRTRRRTRNSRSAAILTEREVPARRRSSARSSTTARTSSPARSPSSSGSSSTRDPAGTSRSTSCAATTSGSPHATLDRSRPGLPICRIGATAGGPPPFFAAARALVSRIRPPCSADGPRNCTRRSRDSTRSGFRAGAASTRGARRARRRNARARRRVARPAGAASRGAGRGGSRARRTSCCPGAWPPARRFDGIRATAAAPAR